MRRSIKVPLLIAKIAIKIELVHNVSIGPITCHNIAPSMRGLIALTLFVLPMKSAQISTSITFNKYWGNRLLDAVKDCRYKVADGGLIVGCGSVVYAIGYNRAHGHGLVAHQEA